MNTPIKSEPLSSIWIQNTRGERLQIEMSAEGDERLGTLYVEDIPYHVYFVEKDELGKGGDKLVVDRDPGYKPRFPKSGRCVLIAPYSE